MKLRDLFVSNAAAATLALGMMQGGSAWAQEPAPAGPGTPVPAAANQNTPAQDLPVTVNRSITFDPLVPVGVIGGLGALYALFCVMAAQKRMNGSWLRMAGGGALAFTLLNPEFREEDRQPLPTEIMVVVDKSPSQRLGDREKTTDEAARGILSQLSGIPGLNVRIVEVGGKGGTLSTDGTELFTPLKSNLADVPVDRLGAVFMITDGQVHDVPTTVTQMLGQGVPLHVLVSGHENERDRRITITQAPRFGIVGAPQEISFIVNDEGGALGGKVKITATLDGQPLAPQFVLPGAPASVKLDIKHAGTNIVELTAEPMDGELTTVNNRVVASIEGVRQNLNVLLVSGSPDPNVRAWRDMLKSDPDINLVHFTTLRDTLNDIDPTPLRELALIGFPADEVFAEKVDKFDLIIFDRYANNSFGISQKHMMNIANRVKAGGAMLMVGGPEYASPWDGINTSPLAEILPTAPTETVLEEPFLPHVTPLGERHPVTRGLTPPGEGQPWGRWLRMVEASLSGDGKVLMDGVNDKPLLVLDRVEKGRVAILLSDTSWLWGRGFDGGGPQADMLRQTVRWLVQDPALEEEALRLRRSNDKIIVEQQTLADKNKPVVLTTPSGETITVTPQADGPGLFRAIVPAAEMGLYRAEEAAPAKAAPGQPATANATAQAFISVGPANPREFMDTHSTTEVLAPAAEETKAHIARVSPTEGAFAVPRVEAVSGAEKDQAMGSPDWAGIRMTEAHILKDVERTPLIPPWLGFAAIIGMVAAAWAREGEWNPFGRKKDNNQTKPAGPAGPSI